VAAIDGRSSEAQLDGSTPDSHPKRISDPELAEIQSVDLAFSAPSPNWAEQSRVKPDVRTAEWRVSDDVVLERVTADPYEISYACLLIPRFQDHRLQGDVEEDLRELMKDICLETGWTLDYLAIQPEYLQWIVRARGSTSAYGIMQVFRRRTSRAILEDFPLLTQRGPMHDFWAPGCVMIPHEEPHPLARVREFINLTRRQQTFRNRREG
jgi:REP element-mobilizing transposase RayT